MAFKMVKPSITILAFEFTGSSVLLPMLGIFMRDFWLTLITMFLWLFALGLVAVQCIAKRTVIDPTGVEYITLTKRYKISWQEIKIVGVGYIQFKRPGSPMWIYFSGLEVSLPMLNANTIGEKYFMVHSRKAIIAEIEKYWTGGIDGLYSESDFEKRHKTGRRFT